MKLNDLDDGSARRRRRFIRNYVFTIVGAAVFLVGLYWFVGFAW